MRKATINLLIFLLLFQTQPALSQATDPAATTTTQTAAPAPVNLDLASVDRSMSPAGVIGSGSVTIQVGNIQRTVTAADALTPAEVVAVQQVATTGVQNIILSDLGAAIGGSFKFSTEAFQALGNLVVPTGVTVVRDFANSALNISGNLTNLGTLYAVSSLPSVTVAQISANNIINQPGATLTTVLPQGGLPGFSSLVQNLNLVLTALQDIVNRGVISSAGSLTATAGGAIINAPLPGQAGPVPIMQALNNLNLQAMTIVNQGQLAAMMNNINIATANLMNAGAIESFNASVAIQNLVSNVLSVENILGTIAAKKTLTIANIGATADQLAMLAVKPQTTIAGGTLAGEKVVLSSPGGTLSVSADRIQGPVEATAGSAALGVKEGDLTIEKFDVKGDPTIWNVGGAVELNAPIVTGGESLAVVAGRDITTARGAGIIDTSSATGRGGDITMIAGVQFYTEPSGGTYPRLVIVGPSETGGRINLTSKVEITTMTTAGGGAAGSGGDVLMLAFRGSGAHSGKIDLPTEGLTIDTAGSGTGSPGNVTMIAGSDIVASSITATGGAGPGGKISITSLQPVIPAGQPLVIEDSKVKSGQAVPDPTKTTGGAVTVYEGRRLIAGSDVSIVAKDDVQLSKTSNQPPYNVVIKAGEVKPTADITKTLKPDDIVRPGSISVTSIEGNVTAQRSTILEAAGDIALQAKKDIRSEAAGSMRALGGYLTFGAGGDVEIAQDTRLLSVARYLDDEQSDWWGGGIAVYTGFPGLDLISGVLIPRKDRDAYPPGYYPEGTGLKIDEYSTFECPNCGRIDLTAYVPDFIHIWKSQFRADGGVISVATAPTGTPAQQQIYFHKDTEVVAIAPGCPPPPHRPQSRRQADESRRGVRHESIGADRAPDGAQSAASLPQ